MKTRLTFLSLPLSRSLGDFRSSLSERSPLFALSNLAPISGPSFTSPADVGCPSTPRERWQRAEELPRRRRNRSNDPSVDLLAAAASPSDVVDPSPDGALQRPGPPPRRLARGPPDVPRPLGRGPKGDNVADGQGEKKEELVSRLVLFRSSDRATWRGLTRNETKNL